MERKSDEQVVDDMITSLSEMVNVMTVKENELARMIVDRLQREHRTLQQSMVCVIAGTLYNYADARSDGRNEAAVKLACDVRETLESNGWSIDGRVYLPLV